ncbi:MAG: FAD-binding protein [Candidatus Bathyarchaeia archaeon]
MEFHKFSDLIVVGAGTAGLPAAIRAKEVDPNVRVTLLEARPNYASSLLMKPYFAIGLPDDEWYHEAVRCGGDPELWKAYTERGQWLYEWLKEKGIHPIDDERWEKPRRKQEISGELIIKTFDRIAREKNVEILFNHRATRLITIPETRRVIGVKVQTGDKEIIFKAKKAVILTTGGFGRNEELIKEFGPQWIGCIPIVPPGHLGDGLKMALDVGAATKYIAGAVVPSRAVCVDNKQLTHMDTAGSIAVDPRGKRFANESESFYGLMTKRCLELIPEKYFYVVYDEKIRQDAKLDYEKPVIYKGNTIEELAKNAGIDPEGLKATIEKYNHDLDTYGYDTVFGRRYIWEGHDNRPPPKIDTPPFYAIKVTGSFTSFKAGVRINSKAQVLNWFNEVIPGLYAAGEVTGGLFYKGLYHPNPSMVTSAMIFGCIAAENAVKEPPTD